MDQTTDKLSTETFQNKTTKQFGQGIEGEIMDVIKGVNEAFHAHDLNKLMSYYDKDIVAYDMPPPLSFKGVDAYRKSWQQGLDAMSEIGPLETAEEKFFISDDLAVFHSLCHMTGTLKKEAQKIDAWSRYTGVFKKNGGKWLIVHEQFSVPIDMEKEKPIWNLKPEGKTILQ